MVEDVGELVALMDDNGVEAIVNLDGRWGDELEANLDRYDRAHPGRFATFCHVDWALADQPGRLEAQLRDGAQRGAKGLKVWKDLGLEVRGRDGDLILPDDDRLGDLFAAAGTLDLPVLIHTADPVAFWRPLDSSNERLEELTRHPEWWYGHGDVPTYEQLMASFLRLVERHPDTTFIGAHVCSAAEDPGLVARWLTDHPNLHLDVSARLGELGRRARLARELITTHPDRVLFGTDTFPPTADTYTLHRRALETGDTNFAYSPDPDDPAPQGDWTIDALGLPPATLDAVCTGNARRLVGFDACF